MGREPRYAISRRANRPVSRPRFVSNTSLRKTACLMRAVVDRRLGAHALGREGSLIYWVRASLGVYEPRVKPIERPAIGHRFTGHGSPLKDPPIPGHWTRSHALPIGSHQVALGAEVSSTDWLGSLAAERPSRLWFDYRAFVWGPDLNMNQRTRIDYFTFHYCPSSSSMSL